MTVAAPAGRVLHQPPPPRWHAPRSAYVVAAAALAVVTAVAYLLWPGPGRDPRVWPFTSNSIWNMPIGSAAVYTTFYATTNDHGGVSALPGIQGPGIQVSGSAAHEQVTRGNGVDSGVDTNWIFYATSSDPMVTVHAQTHWASNRCDGNGLASSSAEATATPAHPWQIRLPAAAVIPDAGPGRTPNNSTAIVQPDGSIDQFNVAARCVAGADDFHATPDWNFVHVDPAIAAVDKRINGPGIYGGHGGSGLSALGGVLTASDITSPKPLHHALSIDINGAEYLYTDGSNGHVWPAVHNDDCATCSDFYGGYHGTTSVLRMGSLLAVDPNVTEASLGLTTALGKKIFHALQDYGAYVVDDTGWSSVDLNIDQNANAAAKATYGYTVDAGLPGAPWGSSNPSYYRDLMSVYAHLLVVSNSSPTAVGGGGAPRVPLAPPLG